MRLVALENLQPDLRLTPGTFSVATVRELTSAGQPIGFLVEMAPSGFMILSGVTEADPEVFVSYRGDYASLKGHALLARILDGLKLSRGPAGSPTKRATLSGGVEVENGPAAVDIERHERLWDLLLGSQLGFSSFWPDILGEEDVPPLLTSHWKQGYPYNLYTPLVDGFPTVAGCVAIAMAQAMNYWECPGAGQGSHSYNWNGQILSANFEHPYSWDRMLDSYDGYYTALEADAVGRLVSDVGISVDMEYGRGASCTEVNKNNALVNFFKYSPDLHFVMRFSYPDWTAWFGVFKGEMDAQRPVVLATQTPNASKSHAIVVDGYRTSPSNEIHVNMGWGENYDCYCSVEDIYGYGSEGDWALVDIHPETVILTLQAAAGGTTDPSPGVSDHPYGSVVTLRAFPDPHFEFLNWYGAGLNDPRNPLDLTLRRNAMVTAMFRRIIYAPVNAAGQKVLNRSLSQAEYINVLTFEANPDNIDITGYTIYLVEGTTRTALATLDANTFQYVHRGVARDKVYVYEIVAVNNEPREGYPATVVVQ